MLIHETQDRLLIRDSPGCWWAVGGGLIPMGLLAVVGAIGFFEGGGPQTPWVRHLSVAAGFLAMAAGTWVVLRSPVSTLEIDRAAGQATLSRGGGTWRMDEIREVALARKEAGEGNPLWRVELILGDGGRVPISRTWSPDLIPCERAKAAIDRILRATHPVQPSPLDNLRARLRM